MTQIQSLAVSQQESLSVQRRVDVSVEREARAVNGRAILNRNDDIPSDSFAKVFDVVDLSEDAQALLLQERDEAFALIAALERRAEEISVFDRPSGGGSVRVDVSEIEAREEISVTETFEVSFERETTLEIETDEGSISVTRTELVEVELAASVTLERSASAGSIQARLVA